MKKNSENSIVIAGFGGQGILFAGEVLANALMLDDKNVTWYPCYGAEMRGGTVNCEIVISDNGSIPTKFEFETPIYLPSNDEYCFVVMCNTDKTEIWISEMGKKAFKPTDTIQPTGEFISKQPYLGSMFISQNSTTWSAEQLKDIKFKINKCKFKNSGNLKLVNSSAKDVYRYPFTKVLPPNALKFVEGSKEVTLYMDGHGWT
jgi:Pyruvate/2-oxoacid:ferredoxin oxidoreductase gamma subunit